MDAAICPLPFAGVDPKSIVCEFFRHGQCTKGNKCKFSHDLSVERKGPKISLFADQRDLKKDGEEDGEGKVGRGMDAVRVLANWGYLITFDGRSTYTGMSDCTNI